MTAVVWIRESVNGLLPVARLGGEVASYRLLRAEGASAAQAVASLMLDVALSMLSQLAFALLGLALLAAAGAEPRLGRPPARHGQRARARGRVRAGRSGPTCLAAPPPR